MFVVVVVVIFFLSFSLLLFDTSVFLQDSFRVDTVLLDEPWYLTKLATHVDGIQPSKKTSCHAFVLPIFQERRFFSVKTQNEQEMSIVTRLSVKLDRVRTIEWLKRSKTTCQYYVLCLSIFH